MYSEYYGLREQPFSLLPDPDFLFLSQKHATALKLLELAVLNQSGFCVVSGGIGTGKTTLIRELLNHLDDRVPVGLISRTPSTFVELLRGIVASFGLEDDSSDAVSLQHRLAEFVVEQYAGGNRTLLIIDEAQNLSVPAMEELRMLCNVNAGKDLLLQIILVGQKELREKLQRPELEQLAQRIALDYHLEPLNEEETAAYITHRLTRAGGSGALFDEEATKLVYRYSEGVPRLINRMCDMSLVYGFSENLAVIDANVIKTVVAGQVPGKTMRILARSLVRTRGGGDGRHLLTQPETVAVEYAATGTPVREQGCETGEACTKDDMEQTGAKKMQETPEPESSMQDQRETSVSPESGDSPNDSRDQEPGQSLPETAAVLDAAAKEAAVERARADEIAAEMAAVAKAAIDKAAAELAAAEKAEAERITAEKALAEKARADRTAAELATASGSAAETARAERVAAEKVAAEKDDESNRVTANAGSETQSAEAAVAEKAGLEKTAMEEAAVAKAAAEKALAERIAAERAAKETAAAADAAVKKARADRVAAEKAAARRVAAAKAAAERAMAEQATARRTAMESAETEKAAMEKSEADASAALRATREKTSAANAAEAKAATAKQLLAEADASRVAAEKATAEQVVAENAAAAKASEEKLALAKVAANIAAAAKQAAEQAAAIRAAADKDAREKEAAAIAAEKKALEAARAAAEQAAVAERGPNAEVIAAPGEGVSGATTQPAIERLLIEPQATNPTAMSPRFSRRSLAGALVMLSVVISGSVWLIFEHGGIGNALQAFAFAPDKMSSKKVSAETGREAAAEAAAMEVSEDVENSK